MHADIINSFVELASRGKKPNFIFVGGSFYQLASLIAFIKEKEAVGIKMSGVICDWVKSPHRRQIQDRHITCMDQDSFIRLEIGDKLNYAIDPIASLKETLKQLFRLTIGKPIVKNTFSNDNPLYLFYPAAYNPSNELWNTVFGLSDYIELIQYDEGLGTYVLEEATDKQKENKFLRRNQPSLFRRFYNYCGRLANNKLQQMRKDRIRVRDYLLFKIDNGRYIANSQHAELYKEAFFQLANSQNLSTYDYKDAVLIVGFDFAKLYNTIPFELIMYKKIFDILNEHNIRIIFRPHPAQRQEHVLQYQEANMEVADQPGISQESLLAISTNKPVAIIGLGSTSQVVANAFWGIPSISITRLLKHELNHKIGDNSELELAFLQQELVSDLFANFMVTPESYDDLSLEIERILSGKYD